MSQRTYRSHFLFVVSLLLLPFGNGDVAKADQIGRGVRSVYDEMKKTSDPAQQEKLIQERVWKPAAQDQQARLKKQKEDSIRAMNAIRSQKAPRDAKWDAERKRALDLAKSGVKPPKPAAQPSPSPSMVASPSRVRPTAQPVAAPPPPTTYTGPVEGGTVSEVLDFNPQPMKAPAPSPNPTNKRR